MSEPRRNPLKNPDGTMRSITDISIVPDAIVAITYDHAEREWVRELKRDHGTRLVDYLRERRGRT